MLWQYTVPRKVVRDLTIMANLFVFPSLSECCSLVQAEAGITNKALVLNTNFLPMLEFSTGNMLHFPMSSNPLSNRPFWFHMARELLAELDAMPSFWTWKEARNCYYNEDWIFTQQIEPLLWRRYAEESWENSTS